MVWDFDRREVLHCSRDEVAPPSSGCPAVIRTLSAQAEQARAPVRSPIAGPGALDWFSGRWWWGRGQPAGPGPYHGVRGVCGGSQSAGAGSTARTRFAPAEQGANAIVPVYISRAIARLAMKMTGFIVNRISSLSATTDALP